MTCCEFVVGALAGQERPDATDPRAVKGRAIFVFAVPIVVVPVPRWSHGSLRFEPRVDDPDGVTDSWVVWGTKAEAHVRQRIRADELHGGQRATSGRPVLDRHEPLEWRRRVRGLRGHDAHVVAADAHLTS